MWHSLFVGGKSLSICLKLFLVMNSLSMANVGVGNFRILAEPFFAVCGWIIPFSKSIFFNVSLCSSTGLNPVSLRMLNIVEYFLPKAVIIMFTCSVVGTFGILSSLWKNGFCHARL